MQCMYLWDCSDHVPILREVILLTNNIIFAHRYSNIIIFNKAKQTLYANTEQHIGGLNSQMIADVQKDESATTEDSFNVNSCC